jgi:hypothetical protein
MAPVEDKITSLGSCVNAATGTSSDTGTTAHASTAGGGTANAGATGQCGATGTATTGSAGPSFKEKPDDSNSLCGACDATECIVQVGNKKTQKVNSKWISCDQCAVWYHGMCQGLQNNDVNMIIKLEGQGVRWYCENCVPRLHDVRTDQNENSATLSKLDNIEQMVKKFTQSYAEAVKANTESIKRLENYCESALKETSLNIKQAVNINQSAQNLMAKNHAMNEIEARRNNAILYGIEENNEITAMEQVEEILKAKLYLHCPKPIQAMRLGKKTGDRPRPIKIKFQDEATKWSFLKRTNSKETRSPGVFCKVDASKEVRDEEYRLREKMRELKKDGINSALRIRNLKIEQKLPSGEWSVMSPANISTKETTC